VDYCVRGCKLLKYSALPVSNEDELLPCEGDVRSLLFIFSSRYSILTLLSINEPVVPSFFLCSIYICIYIVMLPCFSHIIIVLLFVASVLSFFKSYNNTLLLTSPYVYPFVMSFYIR
jgi:hypothetical protein